MPMAAKVPIIVDIIEDKTAIIIVWYNALSISSFSKNSHTISKVNPFHTPLVGNKRKYYKATKDCINKKILKVYIF